MQKNPKLLRTLGYAGSLLLMTALITNVFAMDPSEEHPKVPHKMKDGDSKSLKGKEAASPLEETETMTAALIAAASEERGYDSDDEYARHQKVHNRFFRKNSSNLKVRGAVATFQQAYEMGQEIPPIPLDGFSSRSRILLVREITALMLEKIDDPVYWREDKRQKSSNFTLRFELEEQTFTVENIYSEDQPGAVKLEEIGKHTQIQKELENAKPKSRQIAHAMKSSRKQRNIIRNPKGKSVDYLNTLNFLLDLEVARRLQRERPENPYDAVPIGSAIANFLDISIDGHRNMDLFFKQTGKKTIGSYTFPYGDHNVFEGEVGRRKSAVRKIIRTQKETRDALRPSTCEEIHRHLIETFQGSEGSESGPYEE